MPSLHSPLVITIVLSRSITASAKNSAGCRCQTLRRATSMANCRSFKLSFVKRRQKSPAVVGSGIDSVPRASRKTSSLRRSSMSCRHVASQSAFSARFRT